MDTKTCNKCKEIKSLDCFYKCKTTKNGLRGECKDCFNDYVKKRRVQRYNNDPDYNQRVKEKLKESYVRKITHEKNLEIQKLKSQIEELMKK